MSAFDTAFRALAGLTNYETMVRPPYGKREMNLPRTRKLLRDLGRPERRFPCLQVAGTKGKGTAATAMATVLETAGYRTGLYTSPHLFHVRERFRVDGEWIGEDEFADAVATILEFVEPLRGTPACPTFFELVTALALLNFAQREVDVAVLEVGLGGRLDATSAVRPVASLVTSVGLDHTAVLGRTLALIAREKAGVAKRGVPLVSGVRPGTSAGRAIRETAGAAGAPVHEVGRDLRIRTGRPALGDDGPSTRVGVTAFGETVTARVPLLGRALARDAGLAAATLLHPKVRRRLPVDRERIVAGLERLRVPGRIQVVERSPLLVVDGAHNPDSGRALAKTIGEALPSGRITAVLGGGKDKAVPAVADALVALGRPTRLIFTRPATHPRAADPEALAARYPGSTAAPDLAAALHLARLRARPTDLLLVTGSLYLAGEALVHLGTGTFPTTS